MIKAQQALIWAIQQLEALSPTEAKRDALFLLAEITKKTTTELRLNDLSLSGAQWAQFQAWIHLRKNHQPIAQIIGFQPFWKWNFYVSRHVLTPRADSECLIEAALDDWKNVQKPLKILDLGTGSGCLLLSLLSELLHVQMAVGVDISPQALKIAKKNAQYLKKQGANLPNITWLLGSWDAAGNLAPFDIILANPPYIGEHEKSALAPDIYNFEPKGALFADQGGFAAFDKIFPLLHHLLAPQGKAYIEHGYRQQEKLIAKAKSNNLCVKKALTDDGGNPRALVISISRIETNNS